MNFPFRHIIIIIFSGIFFNAFGQEHYFRFEHLSNEQGLSQNSISSIVQDNKGFIWIGTYDGLNRYDGHNIKLFRNDPNLPFSIADNYIKTIMVDEEGKIWVGTNSEGISVYFPQTNNFRTIRKDKFNPNGLSNNEINAIFIDSDKQIWVGTNDGLNLLKKDQEEISAYEDNEESFIAQQSGILTKVFQNFFHNASNPNTIAGNKISDIAQVDDISLAISTENGISIYNKTDDKFSIFWNKSTQKIFMNKNNYFYFASENNLYSAYFDGYTLSKPEIIIPNIKVKDILADNEGVIWLATSEGIISLNAENKAVRKILNNPLDPSSLTVNDINTLFFDRTQVLWVGTELGGLNKWDPGSTGIELYRKNPFSTNSISSNMIRSIYKDKQNILWIGTVDGGLNKWDLNTNKISRFLHNPKDKFSLPHNHVRCIFEDDKNNLWIGTDGNGACIFDRKTEKFIPIEIEGLEPENKRIWHIAQDHKKAIWLASFGGGLIEYDPITKKSKIYRRKAEKSGSLTDNRITFVYEDNSRILWVGTFGGGLERWDRYTQTFKHNKYSRKDPKTISNDRIYTIFEDSKNTIWISTKAGLNKYLPEKNEFIRFTEANGLPNNVIMGILEDAHRNLWLSTNNGIARFDLNDYSVVNYDMNDGLQSNEFLVGAYFKDLSGKMYFGGINGLNAFYPEKLQSNQYVPQIVILNLKINNKNAETIVNSPLLQNITYTKDITLNYEQNVFSIEFAAMHFSQPQKNKYMYMLYPFDKEWINTDANHRTATYTNIEPGEYIFRVIGSNSDGVWNEEGVSLVIKINPPVWQTWWFRTIVILSVLLGIFFWYWSRINRIKNQKKKLEEEVILRTKEIADKNDEITKQSKELEKLSWVASQTQNAVIIMSPTGEIEWVNAGFKRMFGYKLGEWIKHKSSNIMGPETNDMVKEQFRLCTEKSRPVTYELKVMKRDGSIMFVQANLVPILDTSNNVIKIIAVDSDITDLKKAESEIIAQKEELEEQKEQLELQNRQIAQQNENIKGSIRYALTLQTNILPLEEQIQDFFNTFILYQPKDIVSGDLYWYHHHKDTDDHFLAVIDCTGHGVPGAFMSLISNNLLNEIVIQDKILVPADILFQIDRRLTKFLKQDKNDNTDGMDIALTKIKINQKILNVTFAGSKRPAIIYRKVTNNTEIIKSSRKAIGGLIGKNPESEFLNINFLLNQGDILFLTSDGFADQNDKDRKKFGSTKLIQVFEENASESMEYQKEALLKKLENHMQGTEQRDDITIIGLKPK